MKIYRHVSQYSRAVLTTTRRGGVGWGVCVGGALFLQHLQGQYEI